MFLWITSLGPGKLRLQIASKRLSPFFPFIIKSPHFSQRHGHLGHTILSLSCSRLWPYGCVLVAGKWWTWLPWNALRKKSPPLSLYPSSLAARWVGCLELDCSTLDDMKEATYWGRQSNELEAARGPRWFQIWLVSSGLSTLAEKLTYILGKPQLYFDLSVAAIDPILRITNTTYKSESCFTPQ